ncbi:DUF2474 domain-containing protein [Variovorax guangxiensis]|uniref:DUF2474 domain-containing protein n=1 Tax=Variovorax guangxiensis TaxID=1775474 RepID=A0A502DTR0_9BURK|nr:DUF2474 domain-containing protein [Variovorax guangxiensis]TPG23133.1 DUF2474 domain-containing protein [Variovorax ginsengisoli]TPG27681.1 DUF2474 domain-containing protein [Variovorax guangxiensis]
MATGTTEKPRRLWARRIGWLVVLWTGGVLSVSAATLVLRYVMAWVGLGR